MQFYLANSPWHQNSFPSTNTHSGIVAIPATRFLQERPPQIIMFRAEAEATGFVISVAQCVCGFD